MTSRPAPRLWADEWECFNADTIEVIEEGPVVSPLLGPNGLPLIRTKQPIGFDLRPRKDRNA